MKIAHVLAPAPAGGLERVVQALAIGQQRRGHHVMVLPIVEESIDDHPFAVPLVRADEETPNDATMLSPPWAVPTISKSARDHVANWKQFRLGGLAGPYKTS